MEACRHAPGFEHLVYASSSSVYGDRPMGGGGFREDEVVDKPVSLYAATKAACELMSHSYARLYGLPQTGLRFFTVYGPWGRPDMAYFSFTQKIMRGDPIEVYGEGRMARDFTYIDDIVDGIIRASDDIAKPNADWNSDDPDPATSNAPFRIFNIGNSQPVALSDYVEAIEAAVGKTAIRELLPLQPGDVPNTFADVSEITASVGYRPRTSVREGVANFVRWYREYFG
jgi:UDP-glucuronate 4-epimerase